MRDTKTAESVGVVLATQNVKPSATLMTRCASPNTTAIWQTSRKLTAHGVTDGTGADPQQSDAVRRSLARYRVMAYVVGVGLIVLVFVGVPLQYGAGVPQVAEIVGPIHGAMYVVYLASAVDLAVRAGLRTRQLAAIVAAGFVPFLAFVVERRITRSTAAAIAP